MKTAVFKLTNEDINKAVDLVKETGKAFRAEAQMLTKSCLALEEILIEYKERFGEEREVTLKLKKRYGDYFCIVSLEGDFFNPLERDVSGNRSVILEMLGLTPYYSYTLGVNQITFRCKLNQGSKEFHTILIAFVSGILLGIAGQYIPAEAKAPLLELVNALSDSIFGLMKMIALPVVFLCLICGILGSGTIHSFKKNGVRILRKYLLSMLFMLLFVSAAALLVFEVKIETSDSKFEVVNTIINTVFSMFPDNLLSPFVQGNNIQVILLGILFGCAMLTLGDRSGNISHNCFQLKDVCSMVMSWVGKLIPVLIIVVIAGNFWSGNINSRVFSAWRIIVVYFSTVIAIFLFTLFRTSRKCGISCGELMKVLSVPGIKGLISASTMFCYSDMEEGLKTKLKISGSAVDFGIPLGYTFYQPPTLLYAIFVMYYAKVSGIEVNLPWLLAFLLICFVTGIAVPPVTGGILSLLAALFVTFGIEDSVTAIAFPLMMLLDYPNTSFRVMMLMMEIAMEQADRDKKPE